MKTIKIHTRYTQCNTINKFVVHDVQPKWNRYKYHQYILQSHKKKLAFTKWYSKSV